MLRSRWVEAPVPEVAHDLCEAGYPDWLSALLARRGVEDRAAAEAFLHPDLEQLHDPGLLAGLDVAVERLLRARADGENVALVGDYDVDGVSGTALLTAVLKSCGVNTHPILPHRMFDGYGFQPVHVERAVELDCKLVITIDCGTTSAAAAKAAVDAGLDVVVTDHHLPGSGLPEEVVQINPRQEFCTYPFEELCGAGLAFKLAAAFSDACGKNLDPRRLLRIAALGTIADLVPLRGENRVIAAIGLEELARTRSPGLRALIRTARLKPPFSTSDVGFRIAPRLNAPGRLASAEASLELLLSRDPRRAAQIAEDLDRCNRERQDLERGAAREARERFADRDPMPSIFFGWSEDWHRGVVGIAAGRLAKEFNRPTILLAVEGETATGSGRSIPAIHLHEFLTRYGDRFVKFGGHAQAIGLTIPTAALEDLRRDLEEAAEQEWSEIVAEREVRYELDLEAGQVDRRLFTELGRFEPYGMGNPTPRIRVRGPLRLARAPKLFGQGHLKAVLVDEKGARLDVLGWGWQDRAAELTENCEVLGHLTPDRYTGGFAFQLIDCRPAERDEAEDETTHDATP